MSKEDIFNYGLEGFRSFIRNKIKYQREVLKMNDIQTEASFYSDMKSICEEYYADLNLASESIIRTVNEISNNTRDLVVKRVSALDLKMKESHSTEKTGETKALPK